MKRVVDVENHRLPQVVEERIELVAEDPLDQDDVGARDGRFEGRYLYSPVGR
jgi:hypothetical protein